MSELVLSRRFNARNVELEADTTGQNIGVYKRDGGCRYVPWLGFLTVEEAKRLDGARPVRLEVARIGVREGFRTEWHDVKPGCYVQGCLVGGGAYAIVETRVRLVRPNTEAVQQA